PRNTGDDAPGRHRRQTAYRRKELQGLPSARRRGRRYSSHKRTSAMASEPEHGGFQDAAAVVAFFPQGPRKRETAPVVGGSNADIPLHGTTGCNHRTIFLGTG